VAKPELLNEESRVRPFKYVRIQAFFSPQRRRPKRSAGYGKIATPWGQSAELSAIPVAAAERRAQPDRGSMGLKPQVGWSFLMKWGAVIGGVALAALASLPASSPARAADMTVARPIPAPSYIPAQFFWTGFYMGAGIGAAWTNSKFADPLTGLTATPSPRGFLLSGIGGINYQIGAVVLGAEGDFTGAWVKSGSALDAAGNNLSISVFWTSTITGRVGWAFDRLLAYAKGGGAFAYDRDTVTLPNTTIAVGSTYRAGWTLGGGLEYALTDHWTTRLEYDYLRFPVKGTTFQGSGVPVVNVLDPTTGKTVTFPGTANGTIGYNISEIKAIMAYKF
jgi:outer membrane immunogenic protein